MKVFYRLITVILVISCFVSVSYGQVSKKGRGSDGQAYRIDENGYKLIDQLAELEVTIDEQNREILALENEIAEKDVKIKNCGKGDDDKNSISEADITNEIAAKAALEDCPQQECLCEQKECDYTSATKPLEQKISSLESTIQNLQRSNQLLETQIEQSRNEFAAKTTNQDQTAESKEGKYSKQIAQQASEFENQLVRKESELTSAQEMLQAKDGKERELSARIEQLNQRIQAQEGMLGLYEKQISASSKGENKVETTPFKAGTDYKVSASQIQRAVPKEINEKFALLQKLINDRKSLFDRQKDLRSLISISIQELRTRDGDSLDTLRNSASHLTTPEQVEELMEKLDEIEKILNDDLRVLRRITKI